MDRPAHRNVFADIPQHLPKELVTTLVNARNVRIERILSRGQCSPEGFWYDQPESEWVLVLQGHARLTFEDEVVEMRVGDSVVIPPHRKHRVEWTPPHETTVWLAVHFDA